MRTDWSRSMKGCLAAILFMSATAYGIQPQDDPVNDDVEPNVVPNVRVDNNGSPDDSIAGNIDAPPEYRDPLIRFNRAIFRFNDVSYRYVLVPAARTYLEVTPEPVKRGVGNFFYNLRTPIYAVNHLLQGNPAQTVRDLSRFVVNTTVGIAGIFDPAESWLQIERRVTGAGDTLTQYGVGYGAYLVLPFIGPSNLRNGAGMMLDMPLGTIQYLVDNPEGTAVRIFDNFQLYAPVIQSYPDIADQSQDPYIFLRNMHIQGIQRDAAYADQERSDAN